jgi:hypothetical protein
MHVENANAIVWALCITRTLHMAVVAVGKHKTLMYVLLFVMLLFNSH